MPIIEISSLTDSGVEIFSTLTEAQLRNRIEPDKGLFIAESPKVIHVALNAGYEPLALLCEQKHITGDAAGIIERCGDIPVYTGERKLLATLTGYTLTRGVLCAMRRRALPSAEEVCRKARRIVVIGRGTVELVKDVQEKIRGLNLLMKNQVGREFSITPQMAQTVQVMKITIDNFSAKSRKKIQ